jgi:hypothetical protein
MIVLDTNIVAALMGNGAEIDPWLQPSLDMSCTRRS